MAFRNYDENGKIIRRSDVILDCSCDPLITEQSHRDEVNINRIIAKHGMDLIAKTNQLRSSEFRFDDVSGNDFMEAHNIITKARHEFEQMPSSIRGRFNNSVAEFLDFVQDPKNGNDLVSMGLAVVDTPLPSPPPVRVEVVTPVEPASPSQGDSKSSKTS